MPLQRVTSQHRRVQANAPAASNCLRRVLRRRRAQRPDESVVQGVPVVKSNVYDCLDDVARRMYGVSVPPALRPSLDHRQCRLRTPGGASVR